MRHDRRLARAARRAARGKLSTAGAAALIALALSTLPAVQTTTASASVTGPSQQAARELHPPKRGYIVYWDQNEEEDYFASARGHEGQLVRPWDPNGQMCLLRNGTGDFVVGYNPTLPSQHNPGGPPHRPHKQPPVGESLDNVHGRWAHQNLFVPGPYRMHPGSPGGDAPEIGGAFNNASTFTGCAVDAHHNVFAVDIATAQGQYPPPSSGRLIEWFAPSYHTSCILYGPTSGGHDGAHHVDGTGGLIQPGMMAVTAGGNLLVPQAASMGGLLNGNVLEFDHASFPTSVAQCPDGVYPRSKIRVSVFFQGSGSLLPVPMAIARDPHCRCWAIDSTFGSPSIAWVDNSGKLLATHPAIPGESISQFGHDATGFNPFGMAFAPDGTLYFVDIHIQCTGSGFANCGPESGKGRIMRIAFRADGTPLQPETIANGFDFPTSVTICVPKHKADQPCPFPLHPTPPPDQVKTG